MDSVLTTLSIAGGVTGLIATLATVPFSPARFWSWRLRKHMATVEALDPERHKNQHEVLMRRADVLASRTAAAFHIPMDWGYIRLAIFTGGGLLGLAVASVWLYLKHGIRPWDGLAPPDVLLVIMGPVFTLVYLSIAVRGFMIHRLYRERFIARGCPPDFGRPRGYRQLQIDAFSPNGSPIRARRMRRDGNIPEHWPPSNSRAAIRRRISAWSRARPWYRGGGLFR